MAKRMIGKLRNLDGAQCIEFYLEEVGGDGYPIRKDGVEDISMTLEVMLKLGLLTEEGFRSGKEKEMVMIMEQMPNESYSLPEK